MEEIKVGEEETLNVPGSADTLEISHEWGKTSTVSVSGTYGWTPDSIGPHKLLWKDGSTVVQKDFYYCYVPIMTHAEFIADYDDFSALSEADFNKAEKLIRRNIQVFCGQNFGPYEGQTIEVQGDGGDSLVLPTRIRELTSISDLHGSDLSDLVRISPGSDNILQKKVQFTSTRYYSVKEDVSFRDREFFDIDNIYTIVGDFGWEFVPTDVSNAAGIILADALASDDVTEAKSKGVYELQLGDFEIKMNADQWGTTGSAQADNMLSGYVLMGIGMV